MPKNTDKVVLTVQKCEQNFYLLKIRIKDFPYLKCDKKGFKQLKITNNNDKKI